jgi:lipoyl(octanoyl) transferase
MGDSAVRCGLAEPAPGGGVQWLISRAPVDYLAAVAFMEERVAAIRAGTAAETVWLLEHPPLYTAGTSAAADELLDAGRFPVYPAGRGGRYTYHGPGQRVVYVMLDVRRRGGDIRAFIADLEAWVIAALARLGVIGERRTGRIGIWVATADGSEAKVAAIGVRVRRWVSYHGIAINVAPDLEHFAGIIPCGLVGHRVTSLAMLGATTDLTVVDQALCETFADTVISRQGTTGS